MSSWSDDFTDEWQPTNRSQYDLAREERLASYKPPGAGWKIAEAFSLLMIPVILLGVPCVLLMAIWGLGHSGIQGTALLVLVAVGIGIVALTKATNGGCWIVLVEIIAFLIGLVVLIWLIKTIWHAV